MQSPISIPVTLFQADNIHLLNDKERDILTLADTMDYTFYRYKNLGEMHGELTVVISDRQPNTKAKIWIPYSEEDIEETLQVLEEQIEALVRGHREHPEDPDIEEELYALRAAAERYQHRKNNPPAIDPKKGERGYWAEDVAETLGEYIRIQPSDEPVIVLYINNIRDRCSPDRSVQRLLETYVHECHHFYYDTHRLLPAATTRFPELEEPLAEAGMLYWMEEFHKHYASKYPHYLQMAKRSVLDKRSGDSTCFYGFGYYLFKKQHDLVWQELMYKADKTWQDMTAKAAYRHFFQGGCYPWRQEQTVSTLMLKNLAPHCDLSTHASTQDELNHANYIFAVPTSGVKWYRVDLCPKNNVWLFDDEIREKVFQYYGVATDTADKMHLYITNTPQAYLSDVGGGYICSMINNSKVVIHIDSNVDAFSNSMFFLNVDININALSCLRSIIHWINDIEDIFVDYRNVELYTKDGVLYDSLDKTFCSKDGILHDIRISSLICAKKSLLSITIPNNITQIEPRAFKGCKRLVSIIIPDSVTSIEDGAFEDCSSLTSITIPDSVTSIGESAFKGCSSLTSITIPDSVTSIGESAFKGCSSLTSITIPDSVTSIGESAFEDCSSLASITIPDSVTSIGGSAFEDCSSLASITIPDSVTSIGESAFAYCSSLASITIPDSVTSIERWAFAYCFSLTSITIPDSVTSIGESAFKGCSSLASITIPDSVTSIGESAFKGCSSLTSITIPDSVTSIGREAFANTPWYKKQADGVVYVNNVLYKYKGEMPQNTSILVREGTISIGGGAFAGCSSLSSITIPDSVTSIGGSAFAYCSSLTSITIPDSVTSIGERAFAGCSSLTSITIPDSVTSIGERAFEDCSSLTSITIPDSVTRIGERAFEDCSSLASITIPDSVTRIEWDAFAGCRCTIKAPRALALANEIPAECTLIEY